MQRIPFLDSSADIDLAHYDLIEQFSAREAACLIAGIDPNMQDVTELYGSPEFARMRTIEDAMEYACKTAEDALRDAALDFDFVFSDSARPELSPPWYGSTDLHGELIPMLPCLGHWKALWKINRDGDEKHVFLDTRFDREKFRRQDIVQWLQATRYQKARYFAPNTELDKETAHQAEIDRLQARADMTQLFLDDAKAEIKRLQAELSSMKPAVSGSLSFRYETDLLGLVAKVQAKFLGDNYDHDDPDTRPRKDSVVEWLKEQDPSLSNVTTDAIDRVAMPFNRGK